MSQYWKFLRPDRLRFQKPDSDLSWEPVVRASYSYLKDQMKHEVGGYISSPVITSTYGIWTERISRVISSLFKVDVVETSWDGRQVLEVQGSYKQTITVVVSHL